MIEGEDRVVGVLLAGGQSRRMGGGDKCLNEIGGATILERVIAAARPQVDHLILNTNGEARRFAAYGLTVVPDDPAEFAGPLSGVLAGMEWAATHASECPWLASFPTDTPFLPRTLVARLLAGVENGADIACATSGGRLHPVCALWPVGLRAELRRALHQEGLREVRQWARRYQVAEVPFETAPVDPFFNVNRPEDLIAAEAILAEAAMGGEP